MTKRLPSLFFADNKDILDHLSAHAVFKVAALRSIAAKRGVVLSSRSSKEWLADYISLFAFDRDQLDELLDATEAPERQRPSTLKTFEFGAEPSAVQLAAEAVQKARADLGEEVRVTATKDGVVTVKVTYTELNNSRNRLDQKVVRTDIIDLENDNGGLRIRSTPGRKAEVVIEHIVSELWKEKEPEKPPPPPVEIDLSGVQDANERTQFFYRLFKGMPGYAERGVSDVRVSRLDDDVEDAHSEDDEEESGQRFLPQESEMKNALKAAVLEGVNLLETPVYQQLMAQRYYLTKAVWRARDVKTSLEAEFEAWFHDAKNAADFRYRIKSISERDEEGEQGPHIRPDPVQEQVLTRMVEDAAQKAFAMTAQAVAGEKPEGPSP